MAKKMVSDSQTTPTLQTIVACPATLPLSILLLASVPLDFTVVARGI